MDERACALVCLLTRAALAPELGQPLKRAQVRELLERQALEGLVLRQTEGVEPAVLERAKVLLSRVRAVYDCLRVYEKNGFRFMTPDDARWPRGLERMGANMPLFLFAWGNEALLEPMRIAVAGSRNILAQTREAAERTGRATAKAGYVLVSGGARGVDTEAQRAAWQAAGGVILVPAVPAARLLEDAQTRAAMAEGRVLILCDTPPDEPFSAAKALERNHIIYALGEASLVVASRCERGGSWRGAVDCLKGRFSPVYVWEGKNADTEGNRALEKLGAGTYALDALV